MNPPPVVRAVAIGAGLIALATGCVRVRVGDGIPAGPAARADVEGLLAHGARAWNAGDLDAFMSDYHPDAEFVTQTRLLRGRAEIRERYAGRFIPGASRDSLRFEGLEVDVLGPDLLHAVAYYVLVRGDSVTARGPTSLLLRRVGGRWLIVRDHSS
jgi:uncharacterized protein (TIGR02246 family)